MTIQYQPNNIIFRIASSDSLAKFKASQASAFIQLARSELNFDTSAREVVLLEYDRFSQWLYKIEKMMFGLHNEPLNSSLRGIIVQLFLDELSTIEQVLDSHGNVFTRPVTEFIKVIHQYSASMIVQTLNAMQDDKTGRSFSAITQIIMDYLTHVLASLHEYNSNCILNTAKTFISISDFELKYGNTEFRPAVRRIEFFRRVTGNSNYIVKDYTSINANILVQLQEKLNSSGIELIPEEYINSICNSA